MFVAMTLPNGKRFLLNLDVVLGFSEGDKGEAVAVSLAGIQVTLGETFDTLQADLEQLDADDGPPAGN